jgi:hypothetical protein
VASNSFSGSMMGPSTSLHMEESQDLPS